MAIKTIAEGRYATPDQRERFRDEARAVARLRHPNIVAIHAIGEHEDRPYLSLEYAEGGSLAHRLAERPMAPRAGRRAGRDRWRAPSHAAHQAGVVHRDLKPSNVLLTADGDAQGQRLRPGQAAGRRRRPLTGSGPGDGHAQLHGARAGRGPLEAESGPAADVYALGAILYQALTGRPPFLGDSRSRPSSWSSTTEAVPPRRLRPDVPARPGDDLPEVPGEGAGPAVRVGAPALADDLRRFLDGRPILARRTAVLEQDWRWCRRNPGLAAASLAAGPALAIVAAASA